MQTDAPRIKYGWLRAVLFFISFFIFIAVFDLIGIAIISSISEYSFEEYIADTKLLMENKMMMLMMVSQLFGTLFTVWLFQKFVNREPFTSIGLEFSGYKDDFVSGLFLGVGLIVLGFGTLYIFNFLSVASIQFSLIDQLFYLSLFAVVSLNEEIAIRGYILQNLSRSFNKYIALVLSSLVFMIMHIGNPNMSAVPLFNLFLAGLLLGIYCIHKNNLWFPIGAHITWNYFQGPVLGFEVSGNDVDSIFIQSLNGSELITGGEFGFEGSIILTTFMIIGIIYLDRRYSSA
jgi:membrane protease YdiL (CAAX protease family)